MGNTSRHEQRRVRSLTIVAMVAILLWMTFGDNTGVAAFKIKFDPYRIFGLNGRPITKRPWSNNIGRRNRTNSPRNEITTTPSAIGGGNRTDSPSNGIYRGQDCQDPSSGCCDNAAETTTTPSTIDESGGEKDEPTLLPGHCVDVENKVESLNAAFEANSSSVIYDFFARCTVAERSDIAGAYRNTHKKNLSDDMSTFFRNTCEDHLDFGFIDAHSFTDYLVTILSLMHTYTGVPPEWYYYQTYLTPLTVDTESTIRSSRFVNSEFYWTIREKLLNSTSPDVIHWKIVESQLMSRRSGPTAVNRTSAIEDAKEIHEAIESGNWTRDDNDFHNIMLKRSYPQLREVLNQYKLLGRESVWRKINETFTPDVTNAYKQILRYAENKALFFALKLKSYLRMRAMDVFVVYNIIAILLWRSEIDLDNVKEAYQNMEEISLYEDLNKFPNHWKCLKDLALRLIGE